MSDALFVDYESFSAADLREVGLDNYARHETTDIWFMTYAFDDEPVDVAMPGPLPARVKDHVESGGVVVAHNAAFELAIWNQVCRRRYDWPALAIEQTRCTMAQAYAMALPGALERAAAAVGITQQKDMTGNRLCLQMCRPRKIETDGTIVWWDEPEKIERLIAYGKQDVEVERALFKRLVRLSDSEQRLWQLDQKINNRGVYVDRVSVTKALAVVQSEQDRLNKDIRAATDNAVGFCTEVAGIKKWLVRQGVEMPGLAKADVLDALADESENWLPVSFLEMVDAGR